MPSRVLRPSTMMLRRRVKLSIILRCSSWGPVSASTPAHWVMEPAQESVLVIHVAKWPARAALAAYPSRHPVIA